MKFIQYFKNYYPATSLYLKTAAQIVKPMTDVIVTTFVKDKLNILKEKDIVRLESQMELVDDLIARIEMLEPFVDAERVRNREALEARKNKRRSKKK